jgi:GxxExxY protein
MNQPLRHDDLPQEVNQITGKVIECCYQVHRHLGPGLLENIYELCLIEELKNAQIQYQRQVDIPIIYRGKTIYTALRLDLLIEKHVVVELKAVEKLLPIHQAQLITYLKLAKYPVGLLVNFNVNMIQQGVKRVVLSARNSSDDFLRDSTSLR